MRFSGVVGFGFARENPPGVWKDDITERSYKGTDQQIAASSNHAASVNGDTTSGTTISIIADGYLLENYTAIKYVKFAGAYWVVRNVQLQRPRALLSLGEVYNGPRPQIAAP